MGTFTEPLGGPAMLPRPGTRVVSLFDGQCGICTRSARWIGQRDAEGRIERLDLRDPNAAARFPALSTDEVRANMHAIAESGQVHVGLDAVIAVFDQLPRWWTVAAVLRIPGIHRVSAAGYRWFARNRLRFNRFFPVPPGEEPCTDACAVDWDALGGPGENPPAQRVHSTIGGPGTAD
jgi:predicted DCC family thiol-disulfide oxidoreductase YuxK